MARPSLREFVGPKAELRVSRSRPARRLRLRELGGVAIASHVAKPRDYSVTPRSRGGRPAGRRMGSVAISDEHVCERRAEAVDYVLRFVGRRRKRRGQGPAQRNRATERQGRRLRVLHAFVVPLIQRQLAVEGFPAAALGPLDCGPASIAKTADRQVLGMNDIATACQHAAADAGGLARLDLVALHHRLQRTLPQPGDYPPSTWSPTGSSKPAGEHRVASGGYVHRARRSGKSRAVPTEEDAPSHQEKLGNQKIAGTRVGSAALPRAGNGGQAVHPHAQGRSVRSPVGDAGAPGARLAVCEWALQPGGGPDLPGSWGGQRPRSRARLRAHATGPTGSSCQEANATLGAWPSSCAGVVQRATVSARSPQDSLAARDANRSFPGWLRPTRRRSMPRRAPQYPWSLTSGPRGAGRAG
jgi:hypothetical protein